MHNLQKLSHLSYIQYDNSTDLTMQTYNYTGFINVYKIYVIQLCFSLWNWYLLTR